MATEREIMQAANKTPGNRTASEQKMVDDAKRVGIQKVRNADYNSQRIEKVWGRR